MTSGEPAGDIAATFAEFARTRDPGLRADLIEAHLPLARHFAGRFRDRGQPTEDLVQVASLALVKAVDRFEPERGLQFSTYAAQTILGELKRHFRDRGWSVHLPRRLQELYLQVNQAVGALEQDLGRSPTVVEIAEVAGLLREEVVEALEAGQAYRSKSLDNPTAEGTGSLSDSFGADDDQFERVDQRAATERLLDILPARERLIVHLRFFGGLTQSQIAERVGISQMHVSRLLARSLRQLRGGATSIEELPAVEASPSGEGVP
jgi:RNA polymerase sigma-B factor